MSLEDSPPQGQIAPATAVRVLLADDHIAILRGARQLIEKDGRFKVVGEALRGKDAHRLACELKPDIAILDYSLPELNGLDLSRAIKRDCPATQVLIYSVQDRDEVVFEVLKAGVRGFVVKMDSEQHLLSALEALADGRPYFSPTISDAVLRQFLGSKAPANKGLLTTRERGIVQLIAEGFLNKQIAFRLKITIKTVETHRAAAMRKLGIRTTAELVRWAIRHDLLLP